MEQETDTVALSSLDDQQEGKSLLATINADGSASAFDPYESQNLQSSKRFIYTVTAFSAVGGFLFGYDTGVISGANLFIQEQYNMSTWHIEAIVSIALVGAMIGTIIAGRSADVYGRRPVIAVGAVLFTVGSLLLAIASGFRTLLIGRLIVGFGIGIASNVTPIYVAEISPPALRGRLVTVINLCITSGQFISYLVDSAFAPVPQGWRFMLGLGALPAIVQLVGVVMVVPESPRWYVANGNKEKARIILRKIRGDYYDVDGEIQEIESSISGESGTFKELLHPSLRFPLLLGILLQAFQQLCGINTAMYYSAKILKMAGFHSNTTAILFSDFVAFTNAIFTVVALYLIDRVGRRILLLSSMVGAVVGLIFLGFSFLLSSSIPKGSGYLALFSLVFYVAFFALGLGPVPWCVTSEIYPNRLRGLANSVSTTTNWASNAIVSATFLSYIDLVGTPSAFWTYAAFGVVGFIFFYYKLPETKGKTIEEIQQWFRSHS